MNALVPILGVLATLTFRLLVTTNEPEKTEKRSASLALGMTVIAVLLGAVAYFAVTADPWRASLLGVAAGLACTSLTAALARSAAHEPFFGASLGTVVVSLLAMTNPHLAAFVALVLGAGVGGMILRLFSDRVTTPAYMLGVGGCACIQILATKSALAGNVSGIYATLLMALLVAWVALQSIKSNKTVVATVVFGIAALALGHLVVPKLFVADLTKLYLPIGVGFIGAVITGWFRASYASNRSLVTSFSAALWVGIFTYVFSESKATGASITMLVAAWTLVLMGQTEAISGLAPFAALVLFRVAKELFPDTVSMIDFGQNYALIGLILGLAIAQLPCEIVLRPKTMLQAAGFVGVFALILAVLVLVGPKGAAGLLIGMGIAPLIRSSVQTAAYALSALVLAAIPHFGDFGEFAKEDKLKFLAIFGIPAALLLGFSFLVGGPSTGECSPNECN